MSRHITPLQVNFPLPENGFHVDMPQECVGAGYRPSCERRVAAWYEPPGKSRAERETANLGQQAFPLTEVIFEKCSVFFFRKEVLQSWEKILSEDMTRVMVPKQGRRGHQCGI